MNFGMFRVAAASLKLKVANPSYNKTEIMNAIDLALAENVKLLVTPELSVTGYTCGDLFFSRSLLESAEDALDDIVAYTLGNNICVVVGMPLAHMNKLYNCAVVIQNGMVTNITAKTYPANYNEFYEKRWFDSGKNLISARHDKYHCEISTQNIINICDDVMLGIEICEDLWVPLPPSVNMSLSGANLIVNLSASDEYVEIGIQDTGIGLSEDDVTTLNNSNVYDSSHLGISNDNKGFGFGIMNCKGIINKYKKTSAKFAVCDFGVESVLGKGSRFWFRLPRALCLILSFMLSVGTFAGSERYTSLFDSTYTANIEGRYEDALRYADSALKMPEIMHDTISVYVCTGCILRIHPLPHTAVRWRKQNMIVPSCWSCWPFPVLLYYA